MARWIAFIAVPVALGILCGRHSDAQSPGAGSAFEVASIKLNTGCANGRRESGGPTPGRLILPCVGLRNLIRGAYGIVNGGIGTRRIQVLGGPAWLDTDRYDISAKAEGNAPLDQMAGPMLQRLLEDRFQVKVHKETRDLPVYALTVTKNGLKLPRATEGCTPVDLNNLPRSALRPGQAPPKFCGAGGTRTNGLTSTADWYGVTMAEFGAAIERDVDRPVIDRTGVSGRFDIHLEFVRDVAVSGATRLNGVDSPGLPATSADTSAGPSIFTAVQEQIGLKLSPDRGPVDVLIVDHVEKPSDN